MKFEPLFTLGAVSVLSAKTVSTQHSYAPELIGAVLVGGFIAALFSFWKSRKMKSDITDTGIWLTIALIGSMAVGLLGAPVIAGRTFWGITVPVDAAPFIGLLFTISGTPLIEWLLQGGALRWIRKKLGDVDAADPALGNAGE